MANALTGRVLVIRPTQTMTTKSGSQFTKREIVLDCTRFDPYTGERGYENTPCVNFIQDKCTLLDNVQVGQVVTVYIDITGRKSADKDAYYNDIRGYRIDARQQVSQQSAQQSSQHIQQPPTQAPSQPQHQQPTQQAPQQTYQQPQYPQSTPYGQPNNPYGIPLQGAGEPF